ncbi:MAG: NAD-dependent epimerase/dehydratase family protein [Holophagaceae bacterium]|uniref:NAD-dependent epimerase/dehydratase family protein n=1 Tax=Candidatus Geothrix skivensis TaxID=2954439 RepID=A0A9D7XJ70_9BACT|nr:NAD-dependent epimerase/dehydratase family protein [Candidatus Geothrix skivensis]
MGEAPPGAAYAGRMENGGGKDANQSCLLAGCGYVGVRLARRRLERGPVLALVRRQASCEALTSEGIAALAMDLDEGSQQDALDVPPGLHAVVYLAPPAARGTEDLRLARFLERLGGARPAVLVYLSTTGVYGDTDGAPVDEQSPVAPREDRSRRRVDAERRVAQWCEARRIRWVVLRVPAIYGPHRLPLDRLRLGEPVLRPEDSGPGNRIQVDDLVAACLAALDRPLSGVFNLTDGHPESMAAFTTRVARLAGLPAPPQIDWAEAQRVLSPGLLGFLRESRRVTSCRSQALGLSPMDPEAGIRASLREMGL